MRGKRTGRQRNDRNSFKTLVILVALEIPRRLAQVRHKPFDETKELQG